jgi:hypothetical protein
MPNAECQMLRYVVLRHEGVAAPHFDLMFETAAGSPLATWRLDQWPIEKSAGLTRLGEHRREYLEYQGPVSGDRGQVQRVAQGECALKVRSELIWDLTLLDPPPRKLRLLAITRDLWMATVLR